MSSTKKISLRDNQEGLVAIIVTMLIMIILSLIVLGFAQLTRREQRQSLDRQLSTQAFYAAESGVNDAVKALSDNPGLLTASIPPGCDGFKSAAGLTGQLDGTNVVYTCLIVDAVPSSLEFDSVDTNDSTSFPVASNNGSVLSSITVSWQAKAYSSTFDCAGLPSNLHPQGAPACPTGMLRLDIVPTNTLNRSALMQKNKTLFLAPSSGGSTTVAYDTAVSGDKITVTCNDGATPKACQATITLPTGAGSSSEYYMHVRSIYAASAMTVSANDSAGNPAALKGVQILVDSTGRASDVLRRVQIRVPIDASIHPGFAIQSTDTICKRLKINPGAAVHDLVGVPGSDGGFPDQAPCKVNWP